MTAGAQRIGQAPGIVCQHNCFSLATAAAEMRAVAAQNARVANPVYHVILSWPSSEHPTDDQAFACGAHALAAVGMGGHQYVFGIHRDTGNVHLHIAVNRVSPLTFRAVFPDRDFYKLDRAMRELELRFGWTHDHGPYAVLDREGRKVVDWCRASPDTKGHLPTAAADMERHGDQESLNSYMRGAPRLAMVELLKRPDVAWRDLHGELARWGLELREKGQGFAIHDLQSATATLVKASDMHEQLSKARLVRRLGDFVPSAKEYGTPEQTYDKYRPPMRDQVERADRREERARARRELREQYQAYRAALPPMLSVRAETLRRLAQLRLEARRRRQLARATLTDRAARKAQYSIIAFEMLRAREQIRTDMRAERERIATAYRANTLTFRQWVEGLAATGHRGAISQLRGWAHAAQRKRAGSPPSVGDNRLWLTDPGTPSPADLMPGVPFKVRRDGSIRYAAGLGLIDHGGSIEVLGEEPADDVLLVALLLAARTSGADAEPRGSEAFERQVRALAARWSTASELKRELSRRRDALKVTRNDASP
ncbi:relaxase/mobilization nuclease domain-containing protein [Duganella sp. LX47W]|uniref:Relaxase/mobilization nuclease domain-containing protein n=1 Tax=Rugamonas apoptosis TaxID=2758570 RepID=A0A7W2IK54_9BURK|nr:relaxase/mobilization nuclease domain-containing protein [Rugamonas apoptosis]